MLFATVLTAGVLLLGAAIPVRFAEGVTHGSIRVLVDLPLPRIGERIRLVDLVRRIATDFRWRRYRS